MLNYSNAAAQAIESQQREFTQRLMVDWGNDGTFSHPLSDMSKYVTESLRDQTISSTAPEELMLIEGYAAAELSITVAGTFRGLPLTAHFSPYNGRSAFYSDGLQLGVQMYFDIGVWNGSKWEWFRQFTGIVREIQSNRGTGEVTIDCLDNVERLRMSLDIAAYGIQRDDLASGHKRGGLIDTSSIIDLAARAGGYTMGPKIGIDAASNIEDSTASILSVPFHGSFLPEVGNLDKDQSIHLTETWEDSSDPAISDHAEAYTSGPHGYLALRRVPRSRQVVNGHPYGEKRYWISEQTRAGKDVWGSWTLGTWIYWGGSETTGVIWDIVAMRVRSNWLYLSVNPNDGIAAARVNPSDGSTVAGTWKTMSQGWNYVEAGFEHSTGSDGYVKARVRVNSDTGPKEEIRSSGLPIPETDELDGTVVIQNWLSISDLEIARSNYINALDGMVKDLTLVDNASVSWGRNRAMYTLRRDDTLAWDLAKEVSAAEYGVVFFDENGNFIFWNYDDVEAKQSTTDRVFALADVSGLSMRTTMDSVRNRWAVQSKTAYLDWGKVFDYARDGVPMVDSNGDYIPASEFIAKAGSFNEYFVRAKPNLMGPDPFDVWERPENHPWEETNPFQGMKPYRASDGVYENVDLTTEQKWVGRDIIRFTVRNSSANPDYVFDGPDGIRRYRFRGAVVYENEPSLWTVTDSDSIDAYGTRVVNLKNNFWLQDEFQTRGMLEKLVAKFGRPIPVTDNITVPGDPRIQIGDILEVTDPEGMGASILLQVYGIQRQMIDGKGLTDTYTVEVIEPAGVGVWDDPQYGIWDQSLIWGE